MKGKEVNWCLVTGISEKQEKLLNLGLKEVMNHPELSTEMPMGLDRELQRIEKLFMYDSVRLFLRWHYKIRIGGCSSLAAS